MKEDERLREALVELERLRVREARALRDSNALLDGFERMTRADPPSAAISALLGAVCRHLPAEAALLVRRGTDGAAVLERASPAALEGARWGGIAALVAKPRRLPDLEAEAALAWRAGRPRCLAGLRGLLAAPLPDERGEAALLCLSECPGRFAAADLALLQRMAQLAGQALASERLHDRNALLAAVIDGSSASIVISDAGEPDLPVLYVNPAFERLTGYPAAEMLGRNCRVLSDEPAQSPERRRLRATVAARRHGRFELRNRRRDGTAFWNQLSLYPVQGANGSAGYMIATQIDITDRRVIETERDAARARLVEALSGTSQGMLLLDHAGRVVFANPSYRDAFAAPDAEWNPGAEFTRLWAACLVARGMAPGAARAAAAVRRAALFAGPSEREERLPDGRILLVSDRPTADGGAISTAVDVTAIKAAEELLAARAAAIDAAQDAIAVTDPSGRFVYMNPSHCAMFGFPEPAAALGLDWRALYAEAEAAALAERALPALAACGAWRGEATGQRADGSSVEQEISLTRLASGGMVCVTRDVSARRAAEAERMRLRDQLQVAQRQEAVGQLAAGIAHDFNNLLSVISGSAALMAHDLPEGSPQQGHAARIAAATARAGELIGRLLDLGIRRTERRALDLGAVLGDAADLLRASIPARIRLVLTLPEAPLTVEADPTDILQVVLNLAINARDAIGAGPGEIAIGLGPAGPADRARPAAVGRIGDGRDAVVLSVRDTGCGMAPEEAGRIFEPYYSTKGDAGTGLGLAVVAGIVTENGAALSLETAPGGGTCFSILWPRRAAGGAAAPQAGPSGGESCTLAGALVLIAEDSAPVLGVLSGIFERAGAEVGGCTDPRDALAALEEDPDGWDLLVTDFDMPGLSGAELARAARRAAPRVPVLLCTALPDWRGRDAAGAGLFDAVTAKPVREEALLAAAARAIVRRRTAEETPCAS